MLSCILIEYKGLFGAWPKPPRRAVVLTPQVWRPIRPPRLRRAVAPDAPHQTGLKFGIRFLPKNRSKKPKPNLLVLNLLENRSVSNI
jgi:hypothetical protein